MSNNPDPLKTILNAYTISRSETCSELKTQCSW